MALFTAPHRNSHSTMFGGHHVFVLSIIMIFSTTSQQLWAKNISNSESTGFDSAGDGFDVARSGENSSESGSNESTFLCSKAGNCACLFKRPSVTVKCTSAGDKLDKIASELPPKTTHL